MIQKDVSIRRLLSSLPIETNDWVIEDHWTADLFAIGLAHRRHPGRLVYISTYGKNNNKYDYECETAMGPTPDEFVTNESGQDVEFDDLLGVLKRHLAP